MKKAFVLINCEPGKESSILKQLQELNNVVDVQETFGIYDMVAKIESDSQSHLDNVFSSQIRKLSNVTSTLTLIPTDHQEGWVDLIPDIIPDVIPEQKKPLEEPDSEHEEELDEEDYDDSRKLN